MHCITITALTVHTHISLQPFSLTAVFLFSLRICPISYPYWRVGLDLGVLSTRLLIHFSQTSPSAFPANSRIYSVPNCKVHNWLCLFIIGICIVISSRTFWPITSYYFVHPCACLLFSGSSSHFGRPNSQNLTENFQKGILLHSLLSEAFSTRRGSDLRDLTRTTRGDSTGTDTCPRTGPLVDP